VVTGGEGQARDAFVVRPDVRGHGFQVDQLGTEQYEPIYENAFLAPRQNPLSTFSIDVDTASYANMRRFLTGGRLPPADAVRIEELVNYFRYDYPQPKGPEPFSANMEVAECPWAEGHLLLRVGLKGKDVHRGERPASNLVFLLDVSGSMADENKLPLLKTAMQMFSRELGENDRVSIVTYAGEAGLRLPPTRGHEQEKILAAIESLSSGGSTNGSAGIDLAYEQAKAYFVEGGTNRVILCTDGDLNVGITDDDALVQLIKQKAGGGTFLTVLGFGEGNLKDAKMEKLADNGNGLYAYIDSVREARKVLVEQMTGSTITIAKDVKIQIEFNPAAIASYRLLGYENRVLAAQDFNDDKKDAGEIGAGHTVTALYELVPVGAKEGAAAPQPAGEPLKYQSERISQVVVGEVPQAGIRELTDAAKSGELLTLKLRYKEPAGQASKVLEVPLKDRGGKFNAASKDLQFAAAVASFGMILRGSQHKGSANLAAVEEIASGAIGEDTGGYRAEFVDLVRKAHSLGAR
jgi:Ca-activated chloride channel family protein